MNNVKRFPVFFTIFSIILVTFFVMDLFLELKIINIAGVNLTTGSFLFLFTYIADDCLTEVYGYARARFVMWMTFLTALVTVIIFQISVTLPASDCVNDMAQAFDMVFSMGPRMLTAVLAGYLVSSTINSYIMSRMKLVWGGRFFKTRAFLSSICGRFWDFLLFYTIAYWGVLDVKTVLSIAVLPCLVNTTVEIFMLPVTAKVVEYVKKREGIDVYDNNVSYNPFSFAV